MAKLGSEDVQGGDYHRPRRPNPDTMSYLRSLPLDLEVAHEEIARFLSPPATTGSNNNEPLEYSQSLAAALSALDEVKNEIASLSGDEQAAEAIETLAHITAPYSEIAARKLLHSTSGYLLHMATHRYGSHVLQTVLQVAVTTKASFDMALHEDAPPVTDVENLPSLADLLLSSQQELAPYAKDLAVHVCGSHVLRTLLHVLGGVEQSQDSHAGAPSKRRGRVKSGKSKKRPAKLEENLSWSRMVYVKDSRLAFSDERIGKAIQELTVALSEDSVQPPGKLQELACHSSAGPLLSVLLQVLTYREARSVWENKRSLEAPPRPGDHHLALLSAEPKFDIGSSACALAERLLCWQRGSKQQAWASSIIYGLAGEPRGSHCVETIMRLCPDDFYSSILQVGGFSAADTLQEYAEHDVSTFVVRTVLASVRSQEQALKLMDGILPLVQSGRILAPTKKQRGILWRVAEMAASFKIGQDILLNAMREGFGVKDLKECVAKLLVLENPEKDGDRLRLDVVGTRTLYHLLRFDPEFCKSTLDGVLDLPIDDIVLLSKDSLGSRCVLDGMLDGPVENKVFSSRIKQLVKRLSGQWVSLATDRIGHHVVKKIFRRMPSMVEREALVTELSGGRHRLRGNVMGRALIEACAVAEFASDGREAWARAVNQMEEKEEWLNEFESKADVANEGDGKPGWKKPSEGAKRTIRDPVDMIMEAINIPNSVKRARKAID